MPYSYGLTQYGFKDTQMNDFNFKLKDANKIAHLFFDGQMERFPNIVLARDLLENIVIPPYTLMGDESLTIDYEYTNVVKDSIKFPISHDNKRRSLAL